MNTDSSESLQRWFLWLPVWFGSGISLYFLLPSDPPSQWLQLTTAALLAPTALAIWRHHTSRILLLATTCILAGLSWTDYHAASLQAAVIYQDDSPWWIRATVEHIEHREHGYRVILVENDLWQPRIKKLAASKTPTRIRLNVRTAVPAGIQPGTRIGVKAFLSPPPELPAYPHGYQFARYAFFEQIGAVGYTISPLKIRDTTSSTHHIIDQLRHHVTERIWAAFADDQTTQKTVASALLTAERGAVPKENLTAMRLSGLGHLLAISGLHMALVMMGIFVLSRLLMSLSFTLNLNLPTKKIAASLALISGLIYLMLTGYPVSAVRAYIMAGIFFLAVLADRFTSPMRPVALAALIILITTPEAIIHPSFQMSFAAVIALVGCYDYWNKRRAYRQQSSLPRQFFSYFNGILLTSLVAGTATAPFAMYHFGHFTNYNLLSNLLAIPLTTFWVMPAGITGLAMMPFSVEALPLQLMGAGITQLTDWASYIVSLPHAQLLIPEFSSYWLALMTLGALWLFLWRGELAKYGIIIIVIGWVGALWPQQMPDIIIDETGRLFALRTDENQLAFSSFTRARFARNQWLEATANKKGRRIDSQSPPQLNGFHCTPHGCTKRGSGTTISLIPFDSTRHDCPTGFVIDLRPKNMCKNAAITRKNTLQNGTHVIWLNTATPRIVTARQTTGKRRWTREK